MITPVQFIFYNDFTGNRTTLSYAYKDQIYTATYAYLLLVTDLLTSIPMALGYVGIFVYVTVVNVSFDLEEFEKEFWRIEECRQRRSLEDDHRGVSQRYRFPKV